MCYIAPATTTIERVLSAVQTIQKKNNQSCLADAVTTKLFLPARFSSLPSDSEYNHPGILRHFPHECGVAAAFFSSDTARTLNAMQRALQHRGQDSAGLVIHRHDGSVLLRKNVGRVREVFPPRIVSEMSQVTQKSEAGSIHNRYATRSNPLRRNAQPLVFRDQKCVIQIVHNGEIFPPEGFTFRSYRKHFEEKGYRFQSHSDSEFLLALLATDESTADPLSRVKNALSKIRGSYAAIVTFGRKDGFDAFAFRDPAGNRPLEIGRGDDGAILFASETTAFDAVGATPIRSVGPGEIIHVSSSRKFTYRAYGAPVQQKQFCMLCDTYLKSRNSLSETRVPVRMRDARFPNSRPLMRAGAREPVSVTRQRMGAAVFRQWRKHGFDALDITRDNAIVIGVPNSGTDYGVGFATESKLPNGNYLIRKRDPELREFMTGSQEQRHHASKKNIDLSRLPLFAANKLLFFGGSRDFHLLLVEDSVVRGVQLHNLIRKIRSSTYRHLLGVFGANCSRSEATLLARSYVSRLKISAISCTDLPAYSCIYGVAVKKQRLFARVRGNNTASGVAKILGADHLVAIDIKSQLRIQSGGSAKANCDACVTGNYPKALGVPSGADAPRNKSMLGAFARYK